MAYGDAGHSLVLRSEMAGDGGKGGRKLARRAQRFAVELSMRYREKGSTEWLEGTTLNISASGVLFQSETMLQPRTAIAVALLLPVVIPGEARAEIVCQGRVTRNVPAKSCGGSHALAAAFQYYRISKSSD